MGRQLIIGHCPDLVALVSHLGAQVVVSEDEDSRDLPAECLEHFSAYSDVAEQLLLALVDRGQADPELAYFVDKLIASISDEALLSILESQCLTALSVNDRGFYMAEVENYQ